MKKHSDTITLIYIRNKTGEPHSIEISSKGAKLAIISIAVILLLSTLTSFLAVNLYVSNDRLADEMAKLHGDKKALAEKLLVMERALSYNYNREKEIPERPMENTPVEHKISDFPKMKIEDVRLGQAKEQNAFKLSYKVVNTAPSEDSLKGLCLFPVSVTMII